MERYKSHFVKQREYKIVCSVTWLYSNLKCLG